MKITLINPYDFSAPGLRSLASVLRANGHQVQNLFLLLDTRVLIHSSAGFDCSQEALDEIIAACRDSELIGITLMTNAFGLAIRLTEELKKNLKAPVIWGGIHPTIAPGECLNYADMVCVGEGESSVLNLVNRLEKNIDYLDTEGIWFKSDGQIIRNRVPALLQNLDELPGPGYDNPFDKVLKKQKLISVDRGIAVELLGTQIAVSSSRGCVYRCAFCCNNALNEMYKNQKVVRYKSPAFLISELEEIKSKFKQINRIFFGDDSFIIRPSEEMEEFCRLYKKYIGLPFSCLVTATNVNEEKVELLMEAGLNDIRMGLQSASPRTLKLYNRPISAEAVAKASRIINKYLKDGRMLSYDIILDNPYETKEDLVTTLKFLLTLPRPFSLRFFSLQLYPGTKLYENAPSQENVNRQARSAYSGSYQSAEGTYLNAFFYLMKFIGLKRCPPVLGKLLLKKEVLFILNTPYINAVIKFLRDLRSTWKYSIKLKIKFLSRPKPPVIKKDWTNL
ncbi:MAG: B12-binding domain-containing radical SAM protein [Candidatus Omnitrophica bacterium]|nr:B12-binding domain-containing radical SAM protein [Candidatus Omnitrophota bacterium]